MISAKTTFPCETRDTAAARASALPMESRCLEIIASLVGFGSFAAQGITAARTIPKMIDACRALFLELVIFIDGHRYFERCLRGRHTLLHIADLELDTAVDLRLCDGCGRIELPGENDISPILRQTGHITVGCERRPPVFIP